MSVNLNGRFKAVCLFVCSCDGSYSSVFVAVQNESIGLLSVLLFPVKLNSIQVFRA